LGFGVPAFPVCFTVKQLIPAVTLASGCVNPEEQIISAVHGVECHLGNAAVRHDVESKTLGLAKAAVAGENALELPSGRDVGAGLASGGCDGHQSGVVDA
jgi:hypothetical protein